MTVSTATASRFDLPASGGDAPLVGLVSEPDAGNEVEAWVLYLHGFGSSQQGEKAEFFRRRFVAAGMRFVSLDFQGHGLSGGSIRDLSLSRCLRDVARVRERFRELDARSLIVAGSSMGGLVGLWHATEDQAGAGVFIAPAIDLDQSFATMIGEEGMRRWRESGVLPITNELGTFELGWSFVEDLRERRGEELTRRHRLPAVIFQGQRDDRVSWESVQRFANGTKGATRLYLFADGDHRLLERKSFIWTKTLVFLRQIGVLKEPAA